MSVTLSATTFDAHVEGTKTYGFRIYDDFNKLYDNNAEAPIGDDFVLLEYALTVDDTDLKVMLAFVRDNKQGMSINGTWYDWDEIEDLF